MANADVVKGFVPVKHPSGHIRTTRYSIQAADGTALFIGDLVKSGGTADADGVPGVIQAAAGNYCRGVIVSFEPLLSSLTTMHRTASTLRYCYVADDPDQVFECQEDGDGGALAITAVGGNAEFIVAAGNATTGLSGMELDSSTAATTNTLSLKVLGFVQRPDNEVGVANAKVLVRINLHELDYTTGV